MPGRRAPEHTAPLGPDGWPCVSAGAGRRIPHHGSGWLAAHRPAMAESRRGESHATYTYCFARRLWVAVCQPGSWQADPASRQLVACHARERRWPSRGRENYARVTGGCREEVRRRLAVCQPGRWQANPTSRQRVASRAQDR